MNPVSLLIIKHRSDSPKPGYNSTWEQLLEVHEVDVLPPTQRVVVRRPTMATPQPIQSFPPPLLPQHPPTSIGLGSRGTHIPAQLTLSSAQGALARGSHVHLITGPAQGPSTSSPVLPPSAGINFRDLPTSVSSIQVPNRQSFPVHRVRLNGGDPCSIPTGHGRGGHGVPPSPLSSAAAIVTTTQALGQPGTAPQRFSASLPSISVVMALTSTQGDRSQAILYLLKT